MRRALARHSRARAIRLHLAMAARLMLAHLAGLAALAGYFSFGGGDGSAQYYGFFFLIGLAASLPLLGGLLVVVMVFARWVEDNLAIFTLSGPVAVCLGWLAIMGTDVIAGLALATGMASFVFAALCLLDWPRAHRSGL